MKLQKSNNVFGIYIRKVYFVKIIDNIFLEYRQEDLMTVIPKEYLHQFKNYSQI